jgi:hypothetical protein
VLRHDFSQSSLRGEADRLPVADRTDTLLGSALMGQPCRPINADPAPFLEIRVCGHPGQTDRTVTTVRPILTLSPFLSRWAANMRRPLSQVPLVELRSSTYQKPRENWNNA